MGYLEIFILGWNLNALMFAVNFIIAARTISSTNKEQLMKESLALKELKEDLDKYYPYRTYTTLATYLVPFTAFFRMTFRIIEMFFFFQKNRTAKMFDYMVYKYTLDINRARNNSN